MPPPRLDPARRDALRARLLAWYEGAQRDLPWRRTRDPYAILLSEAMCQQTRVEAALPYYRRFLERWPLLRDMARASEDDLLRAWAGLGYYARARNLHKAVRACVERHEGALPATLDELRALPGIGPYTAGAVGSIAFGLQAPAVDGNVVRVLSRLFALEEEDPRPSVEALAAALVPGEAPGDWNQALMELGALVCIPRAPRCAACPLAGLCDADAKGIAASLPRKKAKKPPLEESILVALVRRPEDGAVLLVKRPLEGLLAGMWAPPSTPAPSGKRSPAKALAAAFPWLEPQRAGAVWSHKFTHRTWTCAGWECALRLDVTPPEGSRYAKGVALREVPTAFQGGLSAGLF